MSDKIKVIGGGIVNKLFSEINESENENNNESNELPMIVMAQYSNDGDNSQEAISMLTNLLKYFKQIGSKDNDSMYYTFMLVS